MDHDAYIMESNVVPTWIISTIRPDEIRDKIDPQPFLPFSPRKEFSLSFERFLFIFIIRVRFETKMYLYLES